MPRKTSGPTCTPPAPAAGFNEAAARCRGKRPVEHAGKEVVEEASMRPRPDAAENSASRRRGRPAPRFNEAAARCRGKRPWAPTLPRTFRSFNEAAARCRGKRAGTARAGRRNGCFNEAAARCRGKPVQGGVPNDVLKASMRPRPDAAENPIFPDTSGPPLRASMRPRPDAAENSQAERPPAGTSCRLQ